MPGSRPPPLRGSLLGWVFLSDMYALFDVLLAGSLVVLFGVAFAQVGRVSADQRVAIASFAVFSLFLLVDMGVAHGLLPWTRMPLAWGLLAFDLLLIGLALRAFVRTRRQVAELTATLEHKVAARTQALERSNTDLQQFAYAISHDLQEPVRMVGSYMSLVQRRYGDRLDDEGREFIDYAVAGARRMADMIQGMLAYARIETEASAFARVDGTAVLTEALANLEVATSQVQATIDAQPVPDLWGDRTQIRSLFQNLVANALRYHAPWRPLQVRIWAEGPSDTGGLVTISVADNGIGIPKQDQARIFKVFERLTPGADRAGLGLGLALCARIVERHGGRLWVESDEGVGATFRFTLPVHPPPDSAP